MARLFIALYPPLDVARALLGLLDGFPLPPHRVTSLDQLHMTVLFIGETPERELRSVVESVERAAAGVGAFELELQGLCALPETGLARLVAAETDAPKALLELRRRLVSRLVAHQRKPAALRPHLTLRRFSTPTRFTLPTQPTERTSFPVESISLQRSLLLPDGAEHRLIARVPLAGG